VQDVDVAIDMAQQAILCHQQNCLVMVVLPPRAFPWWNKELSRLKLQQDCF
jgi:hypothetical protein